MPQPLHPSAAVAHALAEALHERSVPADIFPLTEYALVSLWHGLVAYTDGRRIWWITPYRSMRGRELATFAHHPATAAARLAEHFEVAQRAWSPLV